jgi:D-arabinose 1-dehydrogenase-like Zn-dependent alcohol dehydrogenase
MLEFAATHRTEAVVEVMPLARVNEASERLRRREIEMGLVLES